MHTTTTTTVNASFWISLRWPIYLLSTHKHSCRTKEFAKPRTLWFDFDISNRVATHQMWDEAARQTNKQTVGHETAIGFFHGNSSLFSCILFITSLPFSFCCKQSGNLSDLKKERDSAKLQTQSCLQPLQLWNQTEANSCLVWGEHLCGFKAVVVGSNVRLQFWTSLSFFKFIYSSLLRYY